MVKKQKIFDYPIEWERYLEIVESDDFKKEISKWDEESSNEDKLESFKNLWKMFDSDEQIKLKKCYKIDYHNNWKINMVGNFLKNFYEKICDSENEKCFKVVDSRLIKTHLKLFFGDMNR